MTDPLFPECPVCGKTDGINHAVLEPVGNEYRVVEADLECGHATDDLQLQLSQGVLDLLELNGHSDVFTIKGEA